MASNGRNVGSVVQVDVDALSGAVSTAISQAIRQHSNPRITGSATPTMPAAGHAQSTATCSSITQAQVHSDDGQASTSGRNPG